MQASLRRKRTSENSVAAVIAICGAPVLFKIDAEIRSLQSGGEAEPDVVKTRVSFKNMDAALRREMEIHIYRQMVNDH